MTVKAPTTGKSPAKPRPPKPAKRATTSKAKAPAPAPRRARKPAVPASGRAKGPTRAKRTTARRPGPPRPGPLEASYSSVLFRSRTEARWALFFDLMGWSWDYEPCHYRVGEHLSYLPDFYLPDADVWVEVKGPSFLDAASMGKVASAAAGPHPIQSRRPPYGPARAVVLVGLMPEPGPGRPVHQLVAPAGPGVAGFTRAVWDPDGSVTPVEGKPWLKVPATGAKPARRPTAARVGEILLPASVVGLGSNPLLERAYGTAAGVRFDDATGALVRSTPAGLLAELALRRAGRPLGSAA